ncbi:MAG: sulfite exporter TauE/SafE family protein [Bacteroidota bacterium]
MEGFQVSWDLTLVQWILAGTCGILIGLSKTGVSGVGLAVVPILAVIFGSKPSTGLLLPMLIMADVFAVKYYHRHAQWSHVFKLLPWAIIGITLAMFLGQSVSSNQFSIILSSSILVGVGLMIWQDVRGKQIKVPDNWWFAALMGLVGGFTTMIGNAAGPIMSLYLLSMRLPKNHFIGTGAWFFLIINLVKVPLHVFVWKTIDSSTFVFDLLMFPLIMAGAFLGIRVVKKIPEKPYRILVITTTILAASIVFIKSGAGKGSSNQPVKQEKNIIPVKKLGSIINR